MYIIDGERRGQWRIELHELGHLFVLVAGIAVTTLLVPPSTALQLNSTESVKYYNNNQLRFEVATDGTIQASNNLDMGAETLNITNFFQDTCGSGEAVGRVFKNGSYVCIDINNVATDDQTLKEVLVQGNAANQSINLSGNNLQTGVAGGDIVINDTQNVQDIARFKTGGNVEMPNGKLLLANLNISAISQNNDFVSRKLGADYIFYNKSADTKLFKINALSGNVEVPNGNLEVRGGSDIASGSGSTRVNITDGGGKFLYLDGNEIETPNGDLHINHNNGNKVGIGNPSSRTGALNVGGDLTIPDGHLNVSGGDIDVEGNKIRDSTGTLTLGDGKVEVPNGNLDLGDNNIVGGNIIEATNNQNLFLRPGSDSTAVKIQDNSGNDIVRANPAGNDDVKIPSGNLVMGNLKNITVGSGGLCVDSDGGCAAPGQGGIRVGPYGITDSDAAPSLRLKSGSGDGTPATVGINITANQNIEIPNGDLDMSSNNIDNIAALNSGGSTVEVGGDLNASGGGSQMIFGDAGEGGPHGLRFSDELNLYYRTSANNLNAEHSDGTVILRIDRDNKKVQLRSPEDTSGNTIWHAGNDGSGSGLDADTLDNVELANIDWSDVAMQQLDVNVSDLGAADADLDMNGNTIANVSRVHANYTTQRHDDAFQEGAVGAAGARVALVAGTVDYATIEDDTKIYVNGQQVVDADAGQTGSFSTSQGDIIRSNKPVGLSTNYDAVAPISGAGTQHAFYSNRNAPHTVYMYAPFGTANVSYYFNTDDSGSLNQSLTVQQGKVKTVTLDWDGNHRFYSSAPVVMAKEGDTSDDIFFMPPASREVLTTQANTRIAMDGSATISGSQPYFHSDAPFTATALADGNGQDGEQGLPYRMLGDTYVLAHTVDDYAVASVEPATIKVYNWTDGSFMVNRTIDHTDASRTNPMKTEIGAQSGASNRGISGPVLITGTAPFYVRTNTGTQEYSVIGYRTGLRVSGSTPGLSHPYGGDTKVDFEARNITANGTLDMDSNPIQNVKDPTNPQDAATKSYVDDNDADTDDQNLSEVLVQGNVANTSIDMSGNNLTGIANLSQGDNVAKTHLQNDTGHDIARFNENGVVTIPNNRLKVKRGSNIGAVLELNQTGSTGNSWDLVSLSNGNFAIQRDDTGDSPILVQENANDLQLSVLNNGQTGISTTSPGATLGVGGDLNFPNSNDIQAAGTDAIRFDSSQNVEIPNGKLNASQGVQINVGNGIADGGGTNRVKIADTYTSLRHADGNDAFTAMSGKTLIKTVKGPLVVEDSQGVFTAFEYTRSAAAPGSLNLTNANLDMGGSMLTNITVDGTDTLRFDGSQNVEIPNGNLNMSDNNVTDVDDIKQDGGNFFDGSNTGNGKRITGIDSDGTITTTTISHSNLNGLTSGDDHTQYLEHDGTDDLTGQLSTAAQSSWDLIVENNNVKPHRGLLIENDADAGQNDTALEVRASSSGNSVSSGDTIFIVDAGHKTVGIGDYMEGSVSGQYPDDKLDVKGNIDINSNNLEGISNIYSSSDGTTDFFGDCSNSNSYVHTITSSGGVTCASDTDNQNLSEVLVHGNRANQSIDMNGNELKNDGSWWWGVMSLESANYTLSNGTTGNLSKPGESSQDCDGIACIKQYGNGQWAIEFNLDIALPSDDDNFPNGYTCWGMSAGDNEGSQQDWGAGVRSTITDANGHCTVGINNDCATSFIYDNSADSHSTYGVACKKMY